MPSSACDWSSDVCSSDRSEEHTSELQSRSDLVCRLLLEKKKKRTHTHVKPMNRATLERGAAPSDPYRMAMPNQATDFHLHGALGAISTRVYNQGHPGQDL